MLVFNDTQKQISPCIAAKARYALDPSRVRPINKKTCSLNYWNRVIETICQNNPSFEKRKSQAKEMFNELIKIK